MNVVSLMVARLSFLFSKTTPQLPAKKWIMVIKLGLLSYDFCFKQGQGLRDSAAHPIRGLSKTQRAEKNFFGDRPPTLISGSGWPAPFPHPLYITGRIVTGSVTGRWAYNWGVGLGGLRHTQTFLEHPRGLNSVLSSAYNHWPKNLIIVR